MKNIIKVIFCFIIFCVQIVYSQSKSISFMGNKVVFGSSSSDFSSAYSDYKIDNETTEPSGITVYSNKIDCSDATGNSRWFNIYIKFYNDKLFGMNIDERFAGEKYSDILQKLIKQFKIVKEESDDEESKQELKNENLIGSYGEGYDGTFFTCYDVDIMKEIRKQNPNYEK